VLKPRPAPATPCADQPRLKNAFFWDGRAATLRDQVLQPIQNSIEMHESFSNIVAKLDGR